MTFLAAYDLSTGSPKSKTTKRNGIGENPKEKPKTREREQNPDSNFFLFIFFSGARKRARSKKRSKRNPCEKIQKGSPRPLARNSSQQQNKRKIGTHKDQSYDMAIPSQPAIPPTTTAVDPRKSFLGEAVWIFLACSLRHPGGETGATHALAAGRRHNRKFEF